MPIDRRRFLGALAATPAALAACSGASAEAPRARPGARAGAAEDAERAAAAPRLAAVRTFALPAAAEPAFTFRASLVRAGGP